jgi:hypothetical protein
MSDKIDEVAYALDKVMQHIDALVSPMAQAVREGTLPKAVAADALKKMAQARRKLLEAVPNQDQLQLALALDELRETRKV